MLENGKVQQILDGARAAFFELGYEGASVGEIARRAGVSKGTLYNHFPDKAQLFEAIVRREMQNFSDQVLSAWEPSQDVESSVRGIARRLTGVMCSPAAVSLYRLCAAESLRFPNLGRAFIERGVDVCRRRLGELFAVARSRGELVTEDVDMATLQLAALCRAVVFDRLLMGLQDTPSQEDIDRSADAAAATFLKAYLPPAPRG